MRSTKINDIIINTHLVNYLSNPSWKTSTKSTLSKSWSRLFRFSQTCLLHEWRLQKQLPEVLYKIGVLKSFAKFTGKHLSRSFFYVIKLHAGGLQLYWKRDSDIDVFLWILRIIFWTPFLRNITGRLLLRLIFLEILLIRAKFELRWCRDRDILSLTQCQWRQGGYWEQNQPS